MDTVLVTGGTGHLGREVVDLLKSTYRVRVLARTPGAEPAVEWVTGDLATGQGIGDAVTGAQVVVHAATLSPSAQRGYILPRDFRHSPPDVDVDGTNRLLEAAASAGVAHFAYISIVGVDTPHGAYMRLKHTAEELVRVAGVPWSIMRATPFYWLLDRMLAKATRLPLLPLPGDVPTQPVDTRDFARYVVQCVNGGPGQQREEFGGPEVLPLRELVAQWQRIRSRPRRVLKLPVPSRISRAAAEMTCPEGRRGTTTWSEWLQTHPAE